MNEVEEPRVRPTSITVISILGIIGALISVPLIFSPMAKAIGDWYPPYLAFSAAVGLSCMVGLLMMKRWAVYTYTALVGVNQLLLIGMGAWVVSALVVPAVVIFFSFRHVDKMS